MSANRKLLDRYVERYNAGDLDEVIDLADDAVQACRTAPSWAGTRSATASPRNCSRSRTSATRCAASSRRATRSATSGPSAGTHTVRCCCRTKAGSYRHAGRGQGHGVLRGGRRREALVNTLYYDNLSVLAQLGLVPEGCPTRNAGGEQ